jgi:hypothetical protein
MRLKVSFAAPRCSVRRCHTAQGRRRVQMTERYGHVDGSLGRRVRHATRRAVCVLEITCTGYCSSWKRDSAAGQLSTRRAYDQRSTSSSKYTLRIVIYAYFLRLENTLIEKQIRTLYGAIWEFFFHNSVFKRVVIGHWVHCFK